MDRFEFKQLFSLSIEIPKRNMISGKREILKASKENVLFVRRNTDYKQQKYRNISSVLYRLLRKRDLQQKLLEIENLPNLARCKPQEAP